MASHRKRMIQKNYALLFGGNDCENNSTATFIVNDFLTENEVILKI